MGKKEIGADNQQMSEQAPWHTMSVEETISKLGLPADLAKTGLSVDEAASRLAKYGPNQMTEKEKVTIWQRIWHQINNVLVYVLITVAIVSLIQAVTTPQLIQPIRGSLHLSKSPLSFLSSRSTPGLEFIKRVMPRRLQTPSRTCSQLMLVSSAAERKL